MANIPPLVRGAYTKEEWAALPPRSNDPACLLASDGLTPVRISKWCPMCDSYASGWFTSSDLQGFELRHLDEITIGTFAPSEMKIIMDNL